MPSDSFPAMATRNSFRGNMTIAIIGGTGLYELAGFEVEEHRNVNTPFGEPSSPVTIAKRGELKVAFIARHGVDHKLMPGSVNYRANIWALKSLGCTKLLSIGAVGSLQESIRPGEFCVPDQYIDKTSARKASFFDEGIAAYVSMAEPFCPGLATATVEFLKNRDLPVHRGGTYVVMEGPQLSSKAESQLHRSWGAAVIGMTLCPEAKLAREAEIAYCPLTLVSDYDCWHEEEDAVTAESALAILKVMSSQVQDFLPELVTILGDVPTSQTASEALSAALIGDPKDFDRNARMRLAPILERFLN